MVKITVKQRRLEKAMREVKAAAKANGLGSPLLVFTDPTKTHEFDAYTVSPSGGCFYKRSKNELKRLIQEKTAMGYGRFPWKIIAIRQF